MTTQQNPKYPTWLMLTFIIIGVLAIRPVHAESLEFSMGLSTTHVDKSNEYNEDNKLLTVEYNFKNSDWGIAVATFNNSFYNRTTAVAATYDVYQTQHFKFDIIGGLLKGYTAQDMNTTLCPLEGSASDICWFVAPRGTYVLYQNNNYAVQVSTIILGTAVVTTFGFEYKF